jgi:hypothetical protein
VGGPPFTLESGRVRIGDALFLYLERAFAPPGPVPAGVVPRPHGVAPAAMSAAHSVVASVAPGEGIWLGFQAVARERPVTVRVRLDRATPVDAVTGGPWEERIVEEPRRNHLVCPPDSRLVGVPRADGVHPFGADARADADIVEEIAVIAWVPDAAEIAVQLVRPQRFAELTGEVPDSIDPDSSYKGWRLP